MEITELQAVFGFFFAVQYSSMIGSFSGLQPFPWGFPAETIFNRGRLIWRILVSIVVLNLIPMSIFALGYLELAKFTDDLTFFQILLAGLASLVVYAPYRLYHVIIVLTKGKWLDLYDSKEREHSGSPVKQRLEKIRDSIIGHLIAVVYYSLFFVFLIAFANGIILV